MVICAAIRDQKEPLHYETSDKDHESQNREAERKPPQKGYTPSLLQEFALMQLTIPTV